MPPIVFSKQAMVLPKKKNLGPRKKVLSLQESNNSNSSPPRSLWQSKYESMLPEEENSSSNMSPNQIKPTGKGLSALVGDYNSDSDSDSDRNINSELNAFKDEINKLDQLPETSKAGNGNNAGGNHVVGTTWIQCYDQTTGYPYYWNQATNEVSWQPPAEYIKALQILRSAPSKPPTAAAATPKVVDKKAGKPRKKQYPWETGSDSEDEKIEMITSFGPSDEENQKKSTLVSKKSKGRTKVGKVIEEVAVAGPQLPRGPDEYETSSLMTPLVPDEGPPGVEGPSTPKSNAPTNDEDDSDGSSDGDFDVLAKLRSKAKLLQNNSSGVHSPTNEPTRAVPVSDVGNNEGENAEESDFDLADAILAEIDKEVPPDIADVVRAQPVAVPEKPTNSFALIASYGDDSDTDEVAEPTSSKPSVLFPSAVEPDNSALLKSAKPLFPSATKEISPEKIVTNVVRAPTTAPTLPPDVTETEATVSKAFQRKKRIEISLPGPSDAVTEPCSSKSAPESTLPVSTSNPRYNMDPTAGVRTGFGFTSSSSTDTKIKSQPIQFVKSETINFQPARANSPAVSSAAQPSPAHSQDLIDGATLLREKLTFLGEGKAEVSAIQLMAIQLETLYSAWQSGSLTPEYLCQWLGNRAIELLKNEQAAAPSGWICEWDREKKRYSYRNEATGTKVWDYPELGDIPSAEVPQGAACDSQVAIEEVEMEMSTPPRLSPSPVGNTSDDNDVEPNPPPPPQISRRMTPPPPPPPTFSDSLTAKGKSKYPGFTPPLPTDAYPMPPDEPLPPGVEDLDLSSQPVRPPLPASAWVAPPPPPPDTNLQPNEYMIIGPASGKVEQPTQKKKRSLVSELDSFYSDLAKLDEVETAPEEDTSAPRFQVAPPQPPLPSSPCPPLVQPSPPPSPHVSSFSQEPPKKKKKGKLTPGLTLKKKGVSSLVAKWQQVREDAKKSNSDDEGR